MVISSPRLKGIQEVVKTVTCISLENAWILPRIPRGKLSKKLWFSQVVHHAMHERGKTRAGLGGS